MSQDEELQMYLPKMKQAGITLLACKACADEYSVSGKLANLGLEVKYMGKPFTDMLREEWITITF